MSDAFPSIIVGLSSSLGKPYLALSLCDSQISFGSISKFWKWTMWDSHSLTHCWHKSHSCAAFASSIYTGSISDTSSNFGAFFLRFEDFAQPTFTGSLLVKIDRETFGLFVSHQGLLSACASWRVGWRKGTLLYPIYGLHRCQRPPSLQPPILQRRYLTVKAGPVCLFRPLWQDL